MSAELPELEGLSDAEDFFEALEVDYDPAVLAVHRFALLKLFGCAVEALVQRDLPLGEARRAALKRALEEVYARFAAGDAEVIAPMAAFQPPPIQIGRPDHRR